MFHSDPIFVGVNLSRDDGDRRLSGFRYPPTLAQDRRRAAEVPDRRALKEGPLLSALRCLSISMARARVDAVESAMRWDDDGGR